MAKDQKSNPQNVEKISDSSEFDLEWNVNNVPEMTKAKIVMYNGMVAFKRDVPIFEDGTPTGEVEKKPYFYVEISGTTKPAKLQASVNRKFQQRWGKNPDDWKGKTIIAKYAEAFGKEYLTWTPEGKLD